MNTINRRLFLSGLVLPLAGCVTDYDDELSLVSDPGDDARNDRRLYAALPDEQFPIPAVDLKKLSRRYRRRTVDYVTDEKPGTVIVETKRRHVYLVQADGTAIRYGVGVGRDGFSWQGRARIAWKRAWPRWTPPAEMIERQPELERYRDGMEPGLDNPLGARALYIFEGKRDTLYRLHGTSDPASIGKAVSSGCIRLIGQDVIDLYNRVKPGAEIVVYQGDRVA